MTTAEALALCDAAEARAKAATPGPWARTGVGDVVAPASATAALAGWGPIIIARTIIPDEDETFIAAARTDVPALAEAVRELAGELVATREAWERDHRSGLDSAKSVIAAVAAERDEARARVNELRTALLAPLAHFHAARDGQLADSVESRDRSIAIIEAALGGWGVEFAETYRPAAHRCPPAPDGGRSDEP